MNQKKATRLGNGWYVYRGYEIRKHPNEGFFPKTKYIWEAIDHDGSGFAHSGRLTDTMRMIDEDIDEMERCKR